MLLRILDSLYTCFRLSLLHWTLHRTANAPAARSTPRHLRARASLGRRSVPTSKWKNGAHRELAADARLRSISSFVSACILLAGSRLGGVT